MRISRPSTAARCLRHTFSRAGTPSPASSIPTPPANAAAHSSVPTPAGLSYTLTKTVIPADSDYSASLWHGAYVRWLEEARILHFSAAGVDYGALVAESRTELVVTYLAIRYITAAKLGDVVALTETIDFAASSAVRVRVKAQFKCGDVLIATAEVQLTPICADSGKVVRKWPAVLKECMRGMFWEVCYGDDEEVPVVPAWLAK